MDELETLISFSVVLMIPYPLVIGAAAFTDGAKQQSTPWVAHFEPTEAERRADAERFWDPGATVDDRLAVIDRWQVTGVLMPPGDALADTLAELRKQPPNTLLDSRYQRLRAYGSFKETPVK